jgi:lysophospholipase L1-like esterase
MEETTMVRLKTLAGTLALALLVPAAVLAQPNTGSANFTTYVAIGDSLTAGFMSGSLYVGAQQNSYPALIYRQATGRTTGFEQPLVTEPGVPNGQFELRSLSPLVLAPKAGQGAPSNLLLPRPYNNLGVPGARLRDTLVTHTGGLHDLVLRPSGFGNTTALQQALALSPTFVTIWIGNNDVLAAATSGIVIEGVTLTPVAQFETDYRALAAALVASNRGLAMATIPDVTVIPFVNTVPPFLTVPTTGQRVPVLGPNGPLTTADRVLLPASALLAQGIGVPTALGGTGQPLPDNMVLSAAELSTISARVQAYNTIIRAVATERNAALVDVNAALAAAARGDVGVGGMVLTTTFLTGGLVSYDGVHPTAIGYAVIANNFIEAINDKFGAEIPPVNLRPFLFGTSTVASGLALVAAAPATFNPFGDSTPEFIFTAEARKSLFEGLRIDPNPKPPRKKGGKR